MLFSSRPRCAWGWKTGPQSGMAGGDVHAWVCFRKARWVQGIFWEMHGVGEGLLWDCVCGREGEKVSPQTGKMQKNRTGSWGGYGVSL